MGRSGKIKHIFTILWSLYLSSSPFFLDQLFKPLFVKREKRKEKPRQKINALYFGDPEVPASLIVAERPDFISQAVAIQGAPYEQHRSVVRPQVRTKRHREGL